MLSQIKIKSLLYSQYYAKVYNEYMAGPISAAQRLATAPK